MQETIQNPRPARWIAPVFLVVGGVCAAAAWVLLSLYTQQSSGWMSIAAALACALMLRLGGMKRGIARSVLAALATFAVIVLVNWTVIATQLGFALGLNPWDSALKLGLDYAWTLAGLANHLSDLIWMAVALGVAAVAAR